MDASLPRVDLVGAGRLGRSLHTLWAAAGVDVSLRGRGPLREAAEVVLLAVPDRAIADAADAIPPSARRVVLHASGATDLTPLAAHPRHGSWHPLMSFPGPEVGLPDLEGVPVALDGSDAGVLALGRALAEALGLSAVVVPGDRRLYHAAAVLAGNFATVLLAEAAGLLEAAGVPRTQAGPMLAPLAIASLRQSAADPAAGLTGPVARGDEAVLDAHRAALDALGDPEQRALYDLLVARARRLRPAPRG